ncbi:MAG: HAMP domain-containing histidine kinase [Bacteroidetes bacterium]|nr:HAMP domain-containing histidine kinase [Bacteroidota bacterium]MBS1935915.1 HAMP domain-containing histidine kinase [Bacteroidota bacterium]
MITGLPLQPQIPSDAQFSLHKLADKLIVSLLPKTTLQKSIIINDIGDDLYTNADQQLLASVVSSLLDNAIQYVPSSCIRVSAKAFGYITLVHVRTSGPHLEELFAASLSSFQPIAEKLGGCITISNNNLRGTTMAFTFINPIEVPEFEEI